MLSNDAFRTIYVFYTYFKILCVDFNFMKFGNDTNGMNDAMKT